MRAGNRGRRSERRVPLFGLLLLAFLLATDLGTDEANAAIQRETRARKCIAANDVLCVTIRTVYIFDGCSGGFWNVCTWLIWERITGGGILAGHLNTVQNLVQPASDTSGGVCAWPGFPGRANCTVGKTYVVWTTPSPTPGGFCKKFGLRSAGTAWFDLLPNIHVVAAKTDAFFLCGDGSIREM